MIDVGESMLASVLRRFLPKSNRKGIPQERGPLYAAVRDALKDVQRYANSHGGAIELIDVDAHGEVFIAMTGACRGCPLSDMTIKLGVEEQLKILVPGVSRVTRIK